MGKEMLDEISKAPLGLCLISMEIYVFSSQGLRLPGSHFLFCLSDLRATAVREAEGETRLR